MGNEDKQHPREFSVPEDVLLKEANIAPTTFKEQEVNDALDIAECCVHDQINDPNEREHHYEGLKKVRALALSALRANVAPQIKALVDAGHELNGQAKHFTRPEDHYRVPMENMDKFDDALTQATLLIYGGTTESGGKNG